MTLQDAESEEVSLKLIPVRDWILSLQNPYVEVLTPMWLYSEKGSLGRWLRLSEAIRLGPWSSRTSVLTRIEKDTRCLSLSLSLCAYAQKKSHVRTQLEGGHLKWRGKVSPEINPDSTFILDFWPRELGDNKFLVFKAPALQYFIIAALAD